MTTPTLDTRYEATEGCIFVSGLQALVRLTIQQRLRDGARGLATAGYVSGYRGSPLGTFDLELARAGRVLKSLDVVAAPAINEDLAATAVWGTQTVHALGDGVNDGVFGLWYGKGPGVDRCGDVFRHGNMAGTSRHGGVLLLAGDDHAAKSSTVAHQSEFAFVDAMIPVLHPSSLAEFVAFGLYGIALSRHTGLWVAMKLTGSLVESSGTIDLDALATDFVEPAGPPPDVSIRWPDTPLAAEQRLHRAKWPALAAFVAANPPDRVVRRDASSHIGIVATGKAWLEVRRALDTLGIDDVEAGRRGLALMKVGMTWPLHADAMQAFATGLDTILVVEDKRALIESQLRDLLYALPVRPSIVGKQDRNGLELLPATLELDADDVLSALERIFGWRPSETVAEPCTADASPLARKPSFCSGCPHNTSTVVPADGLALGGIGCHAMAIFTPGSRTATFTQMGGEGASWIGMAPFSKRRHVFQNLGDGTYFHSGSLGIRASLAARVHVTFKILYNDAVAMTGGQAVDGGTLTLASLIAQLRAEGIAEPVVTTDDVAATRLALAGCVVEIVPREQLDAVQRRLAATPGVTALVHAQMCAAEKRRQQRRGLRPAPTVAVAIAPEVCEGCGDCGRQSGCLSIQPLATSMGQKRRIDATSCNVDLSCLRGFCPSFITIENVRPRARRDAGHRSATAAPPCPPPAQPLCLDTGPCRILFTGIGGTGITTLGSVFAMAAHLDGLACSVHDMTGLAQKGGPVLSHLTLARHADALTTPVFARGQADAMVGCDLVVSASADTLAKLVAAPRIVVSTHIAATSDFARDPSSLFPSAALTGRIEQAAAGGRMELLDAGRIAALLVGQGETFGFVVAGAAYQAGCLPIDLAAIDRAIVLNGVAIDANKLAFAWGRAWVADPGAVQAAIESIEGSTPHLEPGIETRAEQLARWRRHLIDYQGPALVARFDASIEPVLAVAAAEGGAHADSLVRSYAEALGRALAPKDEYEVARLLTAASLHGDLAARHDTGGAPPKIAFHLAPPFLGGRGSDGRPRKRRFGSWLRPVLAMIARARALRGTAFDPFRHGAERKLEATILARVELDGASIGRVFHRKTAADCIALAAMSLEIRGFGPVKHGNAAAVDVRWAALSARIAATVPHDEEINA